LTVTGPVTGSNAVASLSVSNSAPGIIDPSPANLPPSAVRGEATSTSDVNVGVLGVSSGTAGAGIFGVGRAGVFGLSTQSGGEGVTGQADGVGATGVRGDSSAGVALQANTSTGRLIVGYKNGSAAFEVDSSGHLNLKDGISLYNGRFNLLFTGAMNAANNKFTLDGSGNLSAQSINSVSDTTVNGVLTLSQLNTPGGTLLMGSTNLQTSGTGNFGLVRTGLLSGGNAPLCTLSTAPNDLRFCSSSLRYKTNVSPFRGGLNIINRLRPISFNWKESGAPGLGLGAEDVAKVAPELTFTNSKGEIEGVLYDQVNVVLVNAIKEQQKQIEKQQAVINGDHAKIEALTKLVCSTRRRSPVCRSNK
jgi:hypothetical protein